MKQMLLLPFFKLVSGLYSVYWYLQIKEQIICNFLNF